jgi:hypothetical protein
MSITVFGVTFGNQPELPPAKLVEIDLPEDLEKSIDEE